MPTIASSGATHNTEMAPNAYDGDANSRWTSGVARNRGMRYWLELKDPVLIRGINARATDDNDNPRKWRVHVADSGGGHGDKIVAEGSGAIVATWEPVRGQWVLIDCLDDDPYYWWSISDLTMDAVDVPPYVEPPVVPPVVPPEEPEDTGPAMAEEPLARYWVEYWAKKFNWYVNQRDVISLEGDLVAWELSVVYLRAKARENGILAPWPFTE